MIRKLLKFFASKQKIDEALNTWGKAKLRVNMSPKLLKQHTEQSRATAARYVEELFDAEDQLLSFATSWRAPRELKRFAASMKNPACMPCWSSVSNKGYASHEVCGQKIQEHLVSIESLYKLAREKK